MRGGNTLANPAERERPSLHSGTKGCTATLTYISLSWLTVLNILFSSAIPDFYQSFAHRNCTTRMSNEQTSSKSTTLDPNTAHQCLSNRLRTLHGHAKKTDLWRRHDDSQLDQDGSLLWTAIQKLEGYRNEFTESRNLEGKKSKPSSGTGSDKWLIKKHSDFWKESFGLNSLSPTSKDHLKWNDRWRCRCEESAKSSIGTTSIVSVVTKYEDPEEANATVPENWDDQ